MVIESSDLVDDGKDKCSDLVDSVKEKRSDLVDDVREECSDLVDDVEEKCSDLVDDVKEKCSDLVDDVEEKCSDLVDDVKEKCSGPVDEVQSCVGESESRVEEQGQSRSRSGSRDWNIEHEEPVKKIGDCNGYLSDSNTELSNCPSSVTDCKQNNPHESSSETVESSNTKKILTRSRSTCRKRSRSKSCERPRRKKGRPRKYLCSEYNIDSEASDESQERIKIVSGVRRSERCRSRSRHISENESEVGSASRIRTRSRSKSVLRAASDFEKSSPEKSDDSRRQPKKIIGLKDVYCWQCHREGSKMLFCHVCPRAYHKRCAKIDTEPETWICIECNSAMVAGSYLNKSEVRNLPQERLNQLFKFVLERIYSHEGSEHFKHAVDVLEYPSYRDYIIHPMDLSLIEKNINNSQYKTTDSFVADVKWLLHNSYIFNSCYSELTSCARAILKTAKQETEEIENCPYCYFHYHSLDDEKWFVEPCKKPHLLVWAKLRGFPHWPAKVMRVVDDLVDVRFFGDHNRSWLSPDSCSLFSQSPPNRSKMGNKDGYRECIKEAFIHIKGLKEKFQEFRFAKPNRKYKPAEHDKMLSEMLPFFNVSGVNNSKANITTETEGMDKETVPANLNKKICSNLSHIVSQQKSNVAPGSSNVVISVKSPSIIFDKKFVSVKNGQMYDTEKLKADRRLDDLNKETGDRFNKTGGVVENSARPKGAASVSSKQSDYIKNADCTVLQVNKYDDDDDDDVIFINDDSDRERCKIDMCKSKKPQVVLTRINIGNNSNICRDNGAKCEMQVDVQSSSASADQCGVISLLEKRDSNVDLSNCREDIKGQDKEDDLDDEATVQKDDEGLSNRILLKVKSSAELLSSEALLRHNSHSGPTCNNAAGSKSPDSQTNNLCLSSLSPRKCLASSVNLKVSNSPSDLKMVMTKAKLESTIEKVIRGDITVTLPSRVLKKTSVGPDLKTVNLNSETDYESNIEEIDCSDDDDDDMDGDSMDVDGLQINPDLEKELEASQDLQDVRTWCSEPFVENGPLINSMSDVFNQIEQCQDLSECKKLMLKFKKLAFLQVKEMKHVFEVVKKDWEEVYQVFSYEKKRLICQKKCFNKNLKKIKLTQWCENCLKEANFYCCWGTSYCSIECQNLDWNNHFKYCNHSDSTKKDDSDVMIVSPSSNNNNSPKTVPRPKVVTVVSSSPRQTASQFSSLNTPACIQSASSLKPIESSGLSAVTKIAKPLHLQNASTSNTIFRVNQCTLENGGISNTVFRPKPKKLIIRQDQLKTIGAMVNRGSYYTLPVPKIQPNTNSNIVLSKNLSGIHHKQNVIGTPPRILKQPNDVIHSLNSSKTVLSKPLSYTMNVSPSKNTPPKQASATS